MRIKSLIPAWRRPSTRTTRSIGAELFHANATDVRSATEHVLEAIMDGTLRPDTRATAVDFHDIVRRHRQSIARKIEDDLALQELVERVDRLSVIAELHRTHPEVLNLLISPNGGGVRAGALDTESGS